MKQAVASIVAAVALTSLALPAITMAASRSPLVPTYEGSKFGHGVQYRPWVIVYTGDGTGALGGPRRIRGNGDSGLPRAFGRLHWTSWTSRSGRATGDAWIDYCENGCATSPHHAYPVRVFVFRPRVVYGRSVFTRVRWTYTHELPHYGSYHSRRVQESKVTWRSGAFFLVGIQETA